MSGSKAPTLSRQNTILHTTIQWVYFAFLFLALPFTFTTSTLDPILPIRIFITAGWLTLLLVLILFSKGKQSIRLHPFVYAWLGFLLFSGLSLSQAINPSEGWVDLIKWTELGIAVWIGTKVLKRKGSIALMCKMAMLCSIGLSLSGLVQLYDPTLLKMPGGEMPYGTMSSKNLLASALFMLLPFVLYGIRYWRIIGTISIVMLLVGLWITKSRGVTLGVMGMVFSSSILLTYFHDEFNLWRHTKLKLKKIAVISWVAGVVIVVSGVVWFLNQDTVQQENSFRERKHLWAKTTQMISDQPLLGVGTGNWKLHLPERGLDNMMYYAREGTTHYVRPHNDFLWVWAETGILGLLSYLALFFLGFWLGIKALQSSKTKHKLLVISILGALVGYLVIANVSFPKERVFHQLFLGLFAVVLMVSYPFGKKIQHIVLSKALQGIAIMILGGMIIISYSRFNSDQLVRRAVDLRKKDPAKAIQLIDKAYTNYYTIDPAVTPLHFYRGTINFGLQKTEEAFKDFQKAEKLHPNHMHVLNNLGTCYELQKNHETAIEYYQKALHISTNFDDARINLGAAYFNKGDYEKALETLKQVKAKDPRVQPYLKATRKKLENG